MARPGDGGITRTDRAQAATASEPFFLLRRTCRLPPRKTVRNKNGVRMIRAPFSRLPQQVPFQAALPLVFIASSASRPVSSAMWSKAAR